MVGSIKKKKREVYKRYNRKKKTTNLGKERKTVITFIH